MLVEGRAQAGKRRQQLATVRGHNRSKEVVDVSFMTHNSSAMSNFDDNPFADPFSVSGNGASV